MATAELFVDPAVSRAKFERELADYRKLADEYARRGWWMIKAEFPEVFVVFAAPQLKPPAVVFGALLDFTNYDFLPPSVRLVDPFTREPYKGKNLPVPLLRRSQLAPLPINSINDSSDLPPQALMQFHNPEDIPFLCMPGVREYHQHPAHSGDLWLLHRDRGEGRLFFILDHLYRYGVAPLQAYHIQLAISGLGLLQGDVPE